LLLNFITLRIGAKEMASRLALTLLALLQVCGWLPPGCEGRGPIQEAIESGAAADYNKDECTWRRGNDRDSCPDPDVHIHLFTPGNPRRKLDPSHVADWLRQDYEPTKDNIILIHGYAGSLTGLRDIPVSWLIFNYSLLGNCLSSFKE
jgi:hypothetical protein